MTTMQMTTQYQCRSRKGRWSRTDARIWENVPKTAPRKNHPQFVRSVSTGQIKQRHPNHHINKNHLAEEHDFAAGQSPSKYSPESRGAGASIDIFSG